MVHVGILVPFHSFNKPILLNIYQSCLNFSILLSLVQQICIVFCHIFYCSSFESTLVPFVPIREHHITVTAFPPPDSGNGISSQSKHRLRDQKMSKDNIDYIIMESSQFMVGLYQKNLSLIQISIDFPLYCRDARKLSVQERKHFPSVWQAGLLLGNNCSNMQQI